MEFNGVSFNVDWVKACSEEKFIAHCESKIWLNKPIEVRTKWAKTFHDILVPKPIVEGGQ